MSIFGRKKPLARKTLERISDGLDQFGGSSWKDVWAFALLILILVFRPQGLLGKAAA